MIPFSNVFKRPAVRRVLMPFTLGIAAIIMVATGSVAIADHHGMQKDKSGDIVDVAVGAGDFGTLAAALEAAGLVDTLKGEGPYTVFAPTDEAFAKLPEGTLRSLLEPENKDQLIAILTYHVVPGEVTASQVVKLDRATTVNGADVDISVQDGKVRVDDATVVATDIAASNGVIHVIDTVILPKS